MTGCCGLAAQLLPVIFSEVLPGAERLAAGGIDHLRKLQDADPRRIETVTQRHYPFGKSLFSYSFTVPVSCSMLCFLFGTVTPCACSVFTKAHQIHMA